MITTTRLARFIPLLAGALGLMCTAASAPKASADPSPSAGRQFASPVHVTAARHDIALNAFPAATDDRAFN